MSNSSTPTFCDGVYVNPPSCDITYAEALSFQYDLFQSLYACAALFLMYYTGLRIRLLLRYLRGWVGCIRMCRNEDGTWACWYLPKDLALSQRTFHPSKLQAQVFFNGAAFVSALTFLVRAIDPYGWRGMIDDVYYLLVRDVASLILIIAIIYVVFHWMVFVSMLSRRTSMAERLHRVQHLLHITGWVVFAGFSAGQILIAPLWLWRLGLSTMTGLVMGVVSVLMVRYATWLACFVYYESHYCCAITKYRCCRWVVFCGTMQFFCQCCECHHLYKVRESKRVFTETQARTHVKDHIVHATYTAYLQRDYLRLAYMGKTPSDVPDGLRDYLHVQLLRKQACKESDANAAKSNSNANVDAENSTNHIVEDFHSDLKTQENNGASVPAPRTMEELHAAVRKLPLLPLDKVTHPYLRQSFTHNMVPVQTRVGGRNRVGFGGSRDIRLLYFYYLTGNFRRMFSGPANVTHRLVPDSVVNQFIKRVGCMVSSCGFGFCRCRCVYVRRRCGCARCACMWLRCSCVCPVRARRHIRPKWYLRPPYHPSQKHAQELPSEAPQQATTAAEDSISDEKFVLPTAARGEQSNVQEAIEMTAIQLTADDLESSEATTPNNNVDDLRLSDDDLGLSGEETTPNNNVVLHLPGASDVAMHEDGDNMQLPVIPPPPPPQPRGPLGPEGPEGPDGLSGEARKEVGLSNCVGVDYEGDVIVEPPPPPPLQHSHTQMPFGRRSISRNVRHIRSSSRRGSLAEHIQLAPPARGMVRDGPYFGGPAPLDAYDEGLLPSPPYVINTNDNGLVYYSTHPAAAFGAKPSSGANVARGRSSSFHSMSHVADGEEMAARSPSFGPRGRGSSLVVPVSTRNRASSGGRSREIAGAHERRTSVLNSAVNLNASDLRMYEARDQIRRESTFRAAHSRRDSAFFQQARSGSMDRSGSGGGGGGGVGDSGSDRDADPDDLTIFLCQQVEWGYFWEPDPHWLDLDYVLEAEPDEDELVERDEARKRLNPFVWNVPDRVTMQKLEQRVRESIAKQRSAEKRKHKQQRHFLSAQAGKTKPAAARTHMRSASAPDGRNLPTVSSAASCDESNETFGASAGRKVKSRRRLADIVAPSSSDYEDDQSDEDDSVGGGNNTYNDTDNEGSSGTLRVQISPLTETPSDGVASSDHLPAPLSSSTTSSAQTRAAMTLLRGRSDVAHAHTPAAAVADESDTSEDECDIDLIGWDYSQDAVSGDGLDRYYHYSQDVFLAEQDQLAMYGMVEGMDQQVHDHPTVDPEAPTTLMDADQKTHLLDANAASSNRNRNNNNNNNNKNNNAIDNADGPYDKAFLDAAIVDGTEEENAEEANGKLSEMERHLKVQRDLQRLRQKEEAKVPKSVQKLTRMFHFIVFGVIFALAASVASVLEAQRLFVDKPTRNNPENPPSDFRDIIEEGSVEGLQYVGNLVILAIFGSFATTNAPVKKRKMERYVYSVVFEGGQARLKHAALDEAEERENDHQMLGPLPQRMLDAGNESSAGEIDGTLDSAGGGGGGGGVSGGGDDLNEGIISSDEKSPEARLYADQLLPFDEQNDEHEINPVYLDGSMVVIPLLPVGMTPSRYKASLNRRSNTVRSFTTEYLPGVLGFKAMNEHECGQLAFRVKQFLVAQESKQHPPDIPLPLSSSDMNSSVQNVKTTVDSSKKSPVLSGRKRATTLVPPEAVTRERKFSFIVQDPVVTRLRAGSLLPRSSAGPQSPATGSSNANSGSLSRAPTLKANVLSGRRRSVMQSTGGGLRSFLEDA